jgi:hypothetical protein
MKFMIRTTRKMTKNTYNKDRRDPGRRACDAAEPEKGRDKGNDKSDESVVEQVACGHGSS